MPAVVIVYFDLYIIGTPFIDMPYDIVHAKSRCYVVHATFLGHVVAVAAT